MMAQPHRVVSIAFIVLGVAQPKGSTKAFMRPGMRFPVVTNDNPKTKPWAEIVRLVAQQHAPQGGPWSGPVDLTTTFYLPRPKSLPKRVLHHTKKPDLDKLVRAVKDALKGVLYLDDSQVVDVKAMKRYATSIHPPGVMVEIEPVIEGGH
jgi:Holliday junction resolvase RusA-like endonuclease